MENSAPSSSATTAVQPVEDEAPVAIPDDEVSGDIPAMSRTFTTPDGVPITVVAKPSAESMAVVRRQSTIAKGSTIDSIISPKPRPAKSFPTVTPTPRPAKSFPNEATSPRPTSPSRAPSKAMTEPSKAAKLTRIFPTLADNVSLFPDHVTLREVTVIVNERTITDREGGLLFQIDHKKTFLEQNG
ncbi:hypothetical protein PRZ48_003652 [Zasmidium cellare]|uniref:Uncharacterized protein n=1 Tax=Zasmidium cellare TaxID=395010 RepID=A0ABR0EW08_ZASCE|nr:hypothetical protein PRZ48_003652 [Zasmidium cellare]